ncbi:hypothetical protein PF010_g8076 [Phytophthora fragariae]|uniref:Uncharacterized protein n=1 Tax=Phytophthora fragariae TaxID=53985 RepID=A0A6G0LFJ6_9STRA|nr:hypothetical protein PF010_g8076 [Phytophthora fragariae]
MYSYTGADFLGLGAALAALLLFPPGCRGDLMAGLLAGSSLIEILVGDPLPGGCAGSSGEKNVSGRNTRCAKVG